MHISGALWSKGQKSAINTQGFLFPYRINNKNLYRPVSISCVSLWSLDCWTFGATCVCSDIVSGKTKIIYPADVSSPHVLDTDDGFMLFIFLLLKCDPKLKLCHQMFPDVPGCSIATDLLSVSHTHLLMAMSSLSLTHTHTFCVLHAAQLSIEYFLVICMLVCVCVSAVNLAVQLIVLLCNGCHYFCLVLLGLNLWICFGPISFDSVIRYNWIH